MANPRRVFPVMLAALATSATGAPAQDVTFTRIIGNGDTLPGGQTFGGGGLPAIDGDYVAINASTTEGYKAIIAYHVPTGEVTVLADTTMVSPTHGVAFKSFGNPTILDGRVVFPAAALLFTSEWEGVYTVRVDEPGRVDVLIDEFFPSVTTPNLPAINDLGVAYTEKSAARGPIFFTDFRGVVEPVALPGNPTPDGGVYGRMDPPVAGGDLVAFQSEGLYSVYAWNARTRETRLVIQEDQPVPGRPGEVFEVVDVADTDGRRVLVTGAYGQLRDVYRGIYAWNGDGLELLVQNTDPIPGRSGEAFDWINPLAIDGDLAIFRSEDFDGRHTGIYGVRTGGEPFLIVAHNQIVAGDPILGATVTGTSLSGNRLHFAGALDRLGRTVQYLAEIDFDTCAADIDGDGELTIFDFLAFQNLFDAGDPGADFDGDGELTIFDFLAFQNAFDAGCE